MDLPKDNLTAGEILSNYRSYLKASGFSTPTIYNYISDVRHLINWISERYRGFDFVFLDIGSLRSYRSYVKEKFRSKPSIAARRLSSLRKFLFWASGQKLVPPELIKKSEYLFAEETGLEKTPPPLQPQSDVITSPQVEKATPPVPELIHQKLLHHIKYTRPSWYKKYHTSRVSQIAHFSLLGIYLAFLGSFILYFLFIGPGLNKTDDLSNQLAEIGDVLAATSPPSVLSFQGRLTDISDVPVAISSDIVFRIYDSETGGSLLWTSKTWGITPDQNGIFSACLGNQTTTDDCLINGVADTAFPATLFTDNASLYLEVEVETETLSPRQRIASVSFAQNADAVDGFHASQSPGANQVTVLDGSGNLIFAGAATLGTGGAGAFTIDSSSGTIIFGAGTNTLINADAATALLLNPTGNLQFQTTSNTIDASGNLVIAGTLTVNGASATIGSGGNTFTFSTSTGPDYAGTTRPTKTATLSPEYAGATLTAYYGSGTDTNISGNMTSDTDTSQGTSIRNYYQWSRSTATQHFYTVAVRITLPKDFSAWTTSNALVINYITGSATSTDSDLDVRVYNENSSTIVASSLDNASTSWSTVTIDDSVLDDGASSEWDATDETAVIYLRMGSQSGNTVRVGDIQLNYLARF